jgi:hypothetical protein
MRAACIGLLLLFAAVSGCAGLDSDGFGENYNGFPWPSLLKKAPPQSRASASVQNLQFSETGRFARQPADSADTPDAKKAAAEDAPAEE